MTPQIGEIFLLNDEQHLINEFPLQQYFSTLKIPPYFTPPSPTCWRGYYGKWQLIENKLFLINFRGYLEGYEEVNLDYIFPKNNNVFASWFSGSIKIPQGKLLKLEQTLSNSSFEEYITLFFKDGILIQYK